MTNPYPQNVPVLIVGAGPTGLTTGLLLAEYGVRSLVVDRNAAPLDIPRAIVLDDEGARVLQCLGIDHAFLKTTVEGDGAEYIDDDGVPFGRFGRGVETYGFPKRNFINQPALEATLHDCADQSVLCEIVFASTVTDVVEDSHGVTVTVTDEDGQSHTVVSQYVVAADGGRSPIRDRLGIKMNGSGYAQDWIVIDTANDPDQTRHSKFFCSTTRPHVSIPAPNGGRRYEFMLLPDETEEMVLEPEFVQTLMASHRKLEPTDIIRKTVYSFQALIAETFGKGRIFLAGDAAHLTPPFAGQGMNAGLRDASNLAWKLACVLNGDAQDALLESYFEERRDPAWAMIQLAVAMGEIVMPLEPEQQAFRKQLLRAMEPFPAVQDYLLKMKFKPPPRYNTGAFLNLHDQPYPASLVGEMIPQPDVLSNGETVKLDALIGSGFALIAQDNAGQLGLGAVETDSLCGLPLAKVLLDVQAVGDARSKALRTHRDQILLIRPDKYCAAAFEPDEISTALAAFSRLLNNSE